MTSNPFYSRGLHPALVPAAAALYDWAVVAGLRPRITSVRRTFQEQSVLYDRYRRGLNPYPVAVPGTSAHERGLAFDMTSDDNATLGRLWEQAGGVWGGAVDPVHFGVRLT